MNLIFKKEHTIRIIGMILILLATAVLIAVYVPIILSRIGYYFGEDTTAEDISRIDFIIEQQLGEVDAEGDELQVKSFSDDLDELFGDSDFGLLIPKIQASSNILPNVDPFNKNEYSAALNKGIAHAAGTSTPGNGGNTFIFAHSAIRFKELLSQNVNFYLLSELQPNDDIYTSYEGVVYHYVVEESKIVNPEEIRYLTDYRDYETLTLMTCWPAGTNYKRVIVSAKLTE